MSLKRIEIEGFKSFPNRTIIDFDKGFTCIVGPNGCGKSNISDAIRWVLGEKSAKKVRGNSMKDVIFSGADQKKEMGYAEVTLYFDNTDRRFRYSGDEFSITRKIFRSRPDNYYYINGKQQKLSEIVELFRDTGAGKDSFSIIGQGKIGEIINAKDTARRLIFDEAAGVAHIKEEKKKTVAKLADVQINMNLKQQSLNYLEEDIKVLAEEVEKAKAYAALSEELKSERLNYFVYIYDTSEETKNKFLKEIAVREEYIEGQTKAADEVRRNIASYDEETEAINQEIDRAHLLRAQLSVDQANLSGELKLHNSNLASSKDNLQKLQKDEKSTEEGLKLSKQTLADREKTLQDLNKQKADGEIEAATVNAKCEVLAQDLQNSEEKITVLSNARLSGADQLGEFLSTKASAEREEMLLKESLKLAEDEFVSQQKVIEEIEKDVQANQEQFNKTNTDMAKANETKRSYGNRKNEATTLRAQMARSLEQLQMTLATKKVEVDNLAIRLKEEHGYNRVTNSVLQRAARDVEFASCVVGAVGDMYKVEEKYRDAIDAALGGSVNNIITENVEKSKKVLEYVRSLHQGRLICQPISEMSPEEFGYDYRRFLNDPAVIGVAADLIDYDPYCEPVYRKLLGKIAVVKDYDNAARLWRSSNHGFKIVTLAGDYFDVSGSISGGDNKSDTDIRYAEAKKIYEQLKAKFDKDKAEYEKLQADEKTFDEKYDEFRALTDDLRMKAIGLQAKGENLRKDKETAEQALHTLVARRATLEEKLARAREEILSAKQNEAAAAGERVNIDDLIASETARRDQIKKNLEEVKERANALEIERQKCIEKINTLITLIEQNKRDILNKESMLAAIRSDIENLNEKIEELIKNTPKAQRTEEQEAKIKEIDERLKELSERRTVLNTKRIDDERRKELINQRILEATSDRSAFLAKLEGVDSELEEWKQSVFEDYGVGYEEAVLYKKEDFEHAKAKAKIGKIKGAITKLGEVNQKAEETYVVKKEEFDKVSVALNDLIKAKEDLEMLNERHMREINEKFTSAFDTINQNFQSTFSDLFGGGKAELYLTESEGEAEDQGVDIDVTLPGKSRKPLSLLSGGEQTLTAIAILFAILKYKGSPFVILDEVESALDEVNCIKFAKYLKQFAKISRFIVITHKKPTMNEGDVLYGVTMMEPGVSNILTVTMEEAVKMSQEENK